MDQDVFYGGSNEEGEDQGVADRVERVQAHVQRVLAPYEGYIVSAQRLLLWETPWQSALVWLTVNILFWMSLRLTTFTLLGLLGMTVVFLDVWFTNFWPQIRGPVKEEEWTAVHPYALSVPEISQRLAHGWVQVTIAMEWLAALRRHPHGRVKFVLLMMVVVGFLLLVDHYVSGVTIAYMAVMGVLLGPCALHHNLLEKAYQHLEPWLMRLEYTMKIKRRRQHKAAAKQPVEESSQDHAEVESDSELEDFVPSLNPKATAALARAITDSEDETPVTSREQSTFSLRPDTGTDSLESSMDSSFTRGMDPMPSFDAMDASQHEWLLSQGIMNPSENQSINFSLSHFHDDRSLQEDSLARGLSFGGQMTPGGKGQSSTNTTNTGANISQPVIETSSDTATPASQGGQGTASQEGSAGLTGTLVSAMKSDTVAAIVDTTRSGLSRLGEGAMETTRSGLSRLGEGASAVVAKLQEQVGRKDALPTATEAELTDAQIEQEFEFLDQAELEEDFSSGRHGDITPTQPEARRP